MQTIKMEYRKKRSNTIILISVGALVGVLLFVHARSFASTWSGPSNAPPEIGDLGSELALDDLVSLNHTSTVQSIKGPLTIFSNGKFPAYLATTTVSNSQVGVLGAGIGSAGSSYVPPEPYPAASTVGMYGFASNGANNYGIYALADSGIALGGRADKAGGFAGYFSGPVEVQENPENSASGVLSVSGTLTTNSKLTAKKGSDFSTQVTVKQQGRPVNATGIIGISSGSASTALGAYGFSSAAPGITAFAINRNAGVLGQAFDHYGLYGYSSSGPGVVGEAEATLTSGQGLYGESRDFGLYGKSVFTLSGFRFVPGAGTGLPVNASSGVGIYACGTTAASQFIGKVYVKNKIGMGIGSNYYVEDGSDGIVGRVVEAEIVLDQTTLQEIFSACGKSCTMGS